MAGFPEQRRALTDAAFATFGEDAGWSDQVGSIRVRFRSPRDDESRFSQSSFVSQATKISVRSWEVAAPEEEQQAVIASGPNAGTYVIIGEPLLDAKGVWTCPVQKLP